MPVLIITSHVGRLGLGAGGRAWRITGPSNVHPPFASERCRKEEHTSKGRKSGHIDIYLEEPGVYELRGVAGFNARGEAFSGFIRLAADGSYEILGGREMSPKAVLAEVGKQD
jgi:hypothetical protein